MSDDLVAARRRKLYASAKELGFTDEERYEFAEYLLRRDIRSWKGLDDAQVCRLLDALEGIHLRDVQLRQRHPSAGKQFHDTVVAQLDHGHR